MTLWDFPISGYLTHLGQDVVERFRERSHRASAAGLLGILNMEDVHLDPAAVVAAQHVTLALAESTVGDSTSAEFLDALCDLVTTGYLLGRILLGTVAAHPGYSDNRFDQEEHIVRLLSYVKLISYAEMDDLMSGAVQEALQQVAGPSLRRPSEILRVVGAKPAVRLVYHALDDGLKLALSEEALFNLWGTLPGR